MNAPTTTRVSRLLALLEQYGPMPFGDLRELLPDVKDTVLSAMLSKLKSRGDVDRCEKGWFVAEAGEEREPPAGDDGEALPPPEEPYRVGDEHPAPTVEQVREVLNRMPKGAPQLPGLKLNPVELTAGCYPGPNPAPTLPAFRLFVRTSALRIDIEGDEADAIAAIRAVAEALEDQARRAKP